MIYATSVRFNDEELCLIDKAVLLLDPYGTNRLSRSAFIRKAVVEYAKQIQNENDMLNAMSETEY